MELVRTIAPPVPRSMSDCFATSTVLYTPVRFVAITSVHSCCTGCIDIGVMPALASTMSTEPSSAVPASNALWSADLSRTSAICE